MRITILVVFTFFCVTTFAQSKTTTSSEKSNELRLNLFMSALGYPEISYEHYLKNNTGFGISAATSFFDDEGRYKSYVIPYYRVYFGSKKALGFFIEGNLASYWVKNYIYSYNQYGQGYNGYPTYTYVGTSNQLGYGAVVGYKFINKSGIIGEISLGVERTHANGYVDYFERLGISLGKSF